MMCWGSGKTVSSDLQLGDRYQQAVVFNHLSETPLANGCPVVCKP